MLVCEVVFYFPAQKGGIQLLGKVMICYLPISSLTSKSPTPTESCGKNLKLCLLILTSSIKS